MGGRLRFLIWLAALMLALGAMSVAVVGLGGAFFEKLDVGNHFTPFWLLGAVVAATVALLGARGHARWPVLAPALVALLIGGWRVGPELVARWTPGAKPEGEMLKLVHFNAYFKNTSPEKSVDWILAQDADIVTIVEAEGIPKAQAMRLRARYPYCNGCFSGDTLWSNLILAKRPALAEGRFEKWYEPATKFPIEGGWSRFSGTHGEFRIVAIHMSWPWLWAGKPQRDALEEFIGRAPTERTILAGDFNMTPWSSALRGFDRKANGLIRRTHGQATWPAQDYYRLPALPVTPPPFLAIDQLYAGKGWRTVSVKRGPRLGSDHFPIVVELTAAKP